MRSISQRYRQHQEEESVFVPMTDLTVSFLFIVMILLAFFAVQFSDEETIPQSVYEKVLNERNKFENIIVTLNDQIGELQLTIQQLNLDKEFALLNSRLISRSSVICFNIICKFQSSRPLVFLN